MLHSRPTVEIQVLFDLRLTLPFGRLIDRKLYALVAVGHYLGHQRRVLRTDVFVVEVLIQPEAHHIAIEIHPGVHGAPADIAHHMIDVLQAHGPRHGIDALAMIYRHEAGQEGAAIVPSLHERVDRIAVNGDGGDAHFALLVAQGLRLAHAPGAAAGGLAVSRFRVVHPKRDVPHAIAVQPHMFCNRMLGGERSGEHQPDLALLQQPRCTIARARLRPAICGQPHPERRSIEVSRLLGVAHVELHVVSAIQRQKVLLSFG